MPIHEYRCSNCEHTIERLEKLDEKPLGRCPECGGGDMKKTFGSDKVKFNLQGEGFHKQGMS